MPSSFIKNRKCPKCNGILYIEQDYYGWREVCAICGYNHDLSVLKITEIHKKNVVK
jgi:DNA-directed RNA polymerase subunit M/transcription elongation factor TFIIS